MKCLDNTGNIAQIQIKLQQGVFHRSFVSQIINLQMVLKYEKVMQHAHNGIHNPWDREQKMLKQAKELTENSDRQLEMNHVRNNENMSGQLCFLSPT